MSESAIRQAIIVVEDDREDRQLIEEAAAKAGISLPMICLENGEQLINLLFHPEASDDRQAGLQPLLIMLDLNLPLAGGKRVLEMLKQNAATRKIPVVMFTTSAVQEEITWAYQAGANSLILKPFSFNELVEIMRLVKAYWFETVELP